MSRDCRPDVCIKLKRAESQANHKQMSCCLGCYEVIACTRMTIAEHEIARVKVAVEPISAGRKKSRGRCSSSRWPNIGRRKTLSFYHGIEYDPKGTKLNG